jgi:type I restriction enzyme S subunit
MLPIGWAATKLADVGKWRGGGTPSKANSKFWTAGTIPWVSPKDMKRPFISDAEDHITAAAIDASATNLIDPGSVLLVTRSGILQHSLPVAINTKPVTINQDLKALTPENGILPEFLKYGFEAFASDILHNCAKSGTTVDSIDFDRLKDRAVFLPPTAEQRRIVAKLDALTARLTRARAELDRVSILAKHLREEVITSVQAQLDSLPVARVKDLALTTFDGPFGSNLKTADYTLSGVRVVRLENIGHLSFVSDKETFITPEKYATLARHRLMSGDILFSSFVDREVRVCLYPGHNEFEAINKADCFVVRADPVKCDVEFLTFMLSAKATYETFKAQIHGVTRPRIGLSQLREFEVHVPTMEKQRELAAHISKAFARADHLEAEAARSKKLLDRLESAILAKAFKGELVPQDPNDEPATQLLGRIRAKRVSNAAAKSVHRGKAAKPYPFSGRPKTSV